MKIVLFVLASIFLFANSVAAETPAYTFSAIKDFKKKDAGEVPLYVDKKRKAVAINAAKESYRGKWAKATLEFKGKSAKYNVVITTLTEEDGECTYKLLINEKEVGVFQNPRVKKENDSKPKKHTWKGISINAGDKITIASNTHSNGIIPENGAFAWARGRWRQLDLILVK